MGDFLCISMLTTPQRRFLCDSEAIIFLMPESLPRHAENSCGRFLLTQHAGFRTDTTGCHDQNQNSIQHSRNASLTSHRSKFLLLVKTMRRVPLRPLPTKTLVARPPSVKLASFCGELCVKRDHGIALPRVSPAIYFEGKKSLGRIHSFVDRSHDRRSKIEDRRFCFLASTMKIFRLLSTRIVAPFRTFSRLFLHQMCYKTMQNPFLISFLHQHVRRGDSIHSNSWHAMKPPLNWSRFQSCLGLASLTMFFIIPFIPSQF